MQLRVLSQIRTGLIQIQFTQRRHLKPIDIRQCARHIAIAANVEYDQRGREVQIERGQRHGQCGLARRKLGTDAVQKMKEY